VQAILTVHIKTIAEEGFSNAFKRYSQVAGRAPAVTANLTTPLPHFSHTVLTEVEDDIPWLLF
jgi:hypothetical protein